MVDYSAFQDDPRYQRMVQKLQRIGPEQRAVMSTMLADETFADEYARKGLRNLLAASTKRYQDKSLDLRSKAFTSRMGLEREAFGEEQRQDRLSTGIGLGQVVAETHFGKQREDIDMALLKRKLEFQNLLKRQYGGA